jgi:hypothetical protein
VAAPSLSPNLLAASAISPNLLLVSEPRCIGQVLVRRTHFLNGQL